ncbi:MAG TPA: hypothetical protein VMV66_01755 [Candidatus Humimicrobiaceae bacterium]|nr:hypothetical protein [Candidatus Humimicrobiaceae bacterium]
MAAKTYDRQTAKFLAVVGENMPELSGDTMQRWIQDPKAVQKALYNAFCSPEAATSRFKIWTTIKLGTGIKTVDEFYEALENNGFNMTSPANGILRRPAFTVANEETEVDLIKITVAELGFKESTQSDQIYERAKDLGFDLCPPEVGPQLRLQYQNQPKGEQVYIGMEPIINSDGSPNVFYIDHTNLGLWLGSAWHYREDIRRLNSLWVFVRPRK